MIKKNCKTREIWLEKYLNFRFFFCCKKMLVNVLFFINFFFKSGCFYFSLNCFEFESVLVFGGIFQKKKKKFCCCFKNFF